MVPQNQVKYINENMQVKMKAVNNLLRSFVSHHNKSDQGLEITTCNYPKVKGSDFFFNTEKIQLLENYTGFLRLRNPYTVFSISPRLTLKQLR